MTHIFTVNLDFLIASVAYIRIEELELLLKKNADVNAIKSVARGRPLPPTLRSGVWKVCAVLYFVIF